MTKTSLPRFIAGENGIVEANHAPPEEKISSEEYIRKSLAVEKKADYAIGPSGVVHDRNYLTKKFPFEETGGYFSRGGSKPAGNIYDQVNDAPFNPFNNDDSAKGLKSGFGSYIKFSPNASCPSLDTFCTDFFDVTGLFAQKEGYGMFPSPQIRLNEFIIRSSDNNTGKIGMGYSHQYVDHEEVFDNYVSYRNDQFKELTRRVPFSSGKFP